MSDHQQPSARVCRKCGRKKILDEFLTVYCQKNRGRQYKSHTCLVCFRKHHAEKERNRRKKDPEKYKEYRRRCRAKDPERARRIRRESGQRLKDLVFKAYGGYRCVCCGESKQSMLTIDHINGDGNKHRSKLAHGKTYATRRSGLGDYLYRDLRDKGFPKIVQVLCYNCNISKHRLGECEHRKGSETRAKARRAKRSEARTTRSG